MLHSVFEYEDFPMYSNTNTNTFWSIHVYIHEYLEYFQNTNFMLSFICKNDVFIGWGECKLCTKSKMVYKHVVNIIIYFGDMWHIITSVGISTCSKLQ
jgi:hypothetical protein